MQYYTGIWNGSFTVDVYNCGILTLQCIATWNICCIKKCTNTGPCAVNTSIDTIVRIELFSFVVSHYTMEYSLFILSTRINHGWK